MTYFKVTWSNMATKPSFKVKKLACNWPYLQNSMRYFALLFVIFLCYNTNKTHLVRAANLFTAHEARGCMPYMRVRRHTLKPKVIYAVSRTAYDAKGLRQAGSVSRCRCSDHEIALTLVLPTFWSILEWRHGFRLAL